MAYNWNGCWVLSCLYRPKSPIYIVSYPVMCMSYNHPPRYLRPPILPFCPHGIIHPFYVYCCGYFSHTTTVVVRPLFCLLCSLIASRHICSYFSINLDFERVLILFRLVSAPTPPPLSCCMEPCRTVHAPTPQKACHYSNRIKIFDWTCQFNLLYRWCFIVWKTMRNDCWAWADVRGVASMTNVTSARFARVTSGLWRNSKQVCRTCLSSRQDHLEKFIWHHEISVIKIKTQTLICYKVSVVEVKFIP